MMTGTANSYQCTCRKGFSLSEDQHNCTDVDECAVEELNNCDQMCTVTGDGWYNCSCEDGFTLDQDNHTCNDINECATNGTTLCELTGSDCNNTLGSYQCICQEGYEFNELHQLCEDIDECATDGAALCQQQCNNLDGGYNCSCFTWYLPDGPYNCTEIDVCMENHTCNASSGVWRSFRLCEFS
jgi:hypothetical protein